MKCGTAIGSPPGFFDGRSETTFVSAIELQTIDDDLDVATGCNGVARRDFVDVANFAANEQTSIARVEKGFAHFEELFGATDGHAIRHERRLASMARDGLFRGTSRVDTNRRNIAIRTNRNGLAGKQRCEVWFEVRHGGNGRTRALDGRSSIDGYTRSDGIELVDGRPFQTLEKLPCVRTEAFDESTLALGIERIEREGRLSRAGHTDDTDELSGGEIEVDALEVVGSRAA